MPETTTMPLAPMTPHAAISALNYLRAVQADDVEAAREFAGAEPQMPQLLVDVATRIVVPVTAIRAMHGIDPEPVDDSFALETLGRVFVSSLRIWAQAGPDTAEGVARAVIDFVAQFFTEDHEDVADVLRQLEAVGVGQALDAHPASAGAHPVRHTSTAVHSLTRERDQHLPGDRWLSRHSVTGTRLVHRVSRCVPRRGSRAGRDRAGRPLPADRTDRCGRVRAGLAGARPAEA